MSNPPNSSANGTSPLRAWAQLVRLPNVFTVIADVSAAFLLVAHGPQPIARWLCVVAGGIALYWAGMILNDVFDIEQDRKLRPERPIAAGQIALSQAKTAGWGLLVIGVAVSALSGYLPSDTIGSTWLPGAIALGLAVMIVAYDGPLKATHAAPAAMGACRMLSFLLGAAPAIAIVSDGTIIPKYVLGIAFGFGIYIMGVTTMARHEATGGEATTLKIGVLFTALGSLCLAFAPLLAEGPMPWHVSPQRIFPVLIGMIAFPVVMRGMRTVHDPTPINIQTTIRIGILTIIPLAACFALLGAGPLWGFAVIALIVPSIALAMRFRVT